MQTESEHMDMDVNLIAAPINQEPSDRRTVLKYNFLFGTAINYNFYLKRPIISFYPMSRA